MFILFVHILGAMEYYADWSEPTESCFIVTDSQDDSQISQVNIIVNNHCSYVLLLHCLIS